MEITYYLIIALKIIVSVSIINVWLLQANKNTKWRGGNATTIFEEFEAYGLSRTTCYVVGFLKVGAAITLLASIQYTHLAVTASSILAILLLGSIAMHLKIKDPLYKSFPAFLFLLMNLAIIYLSL